MRSYGIYETFSMCIHLLTFNTCMLSVTSKHLLPNMIFNLIGEITLHFENADPVKHILETRITRDWSRNLLLSNQKRRRIITPKRFLPLPCNKSLLNLFCVTLRLFNELLWFFYQRVIFTHDKSYKLSLIGNQTVWSRLFDKMDA
jgi:hypothetical protein